MVAVKAWLKAKEQTVTSKISSGNWKPWGETARG